jgi:crotonobetainyl-CoA:carnitine CoA-transferase CaiB-like acyl-CoA transferase
VNAGRGAVTAILEPIFASNTSAHWVARLQEARAPVTTIQPRAEWMSSPIVRDNNGSINLVHPVLGPVTMPNVPVILSETPGSVRGFAREVEPVDEASIWTPRHAGPSSETGSETRSEVSSEPAPPLTLPLDGVTVVDGSSFLAGPMISTLLADMGANVIKVEAPGGDTYRTYPLSFLAVNQRKQGIEIDLKRPEGIQTLHALLAPADVFVENLRPKALAELGLDEDTGTPRFPRLVHCAVSAFGRAEAFAGFPAFDPIFQSLNGMASAQGGDDEPTVGTAPLNDVATGALGAFGALAALYHRRISGRGQRIWLSLAASSTFVQCGEFTTWAGSPEPARGGLLFRGPDQGHRYYQCADGWIAVAALTEQLRVRMAAALGIDDLALAGAALQPQSVAKAVELLSAQGVPGCRVVPRTLPMRDPFLVDNGFSHLVELPPDGIARVVDHHSHWPAAPSPRESRFFAPGENAQAVLAAAGVQPTETDRDRLSTD